MILLLLALPLAAATVHIQYSTDNLTWANITSISELAKEGYQIALQQDTKYYLRGENDNGTYEPGWHYISQRTKEGVDNMWILAVLIIPLGLCFFFVYLAQTLNEEHNPLRWFFRLIALVMIFIIYQGAHVMIGLNPDYADLAQMFDVQTYGWIFWTIMAYMLIYIIYQIFKSFQHAKEWDFSDRWMR